MNPSRPVFCALSERTGRERYEDGNSCGDAIAKALKCVHSKDGHDIDDLTVCVKDNGCAVPKVDMESHGAAGRLRMVAGLMLRAATKKRSITIGDQTFGEDNHRQAWQGEARTESRFMKPSV